MEELSFPFALLGASRQIADARTPVYARRDYEVCTIEYVDRGEGYLQENEFSGHIGPDSIYFLQKHSTHRYEPERSNPWHKLCLVVDGPLVELLLAAYRLDSVYVIEEAQELKHYFLELLQLEPVRQRRHERAAVLFHEFCEACSRKLARSRRRVDPVAEELRQMLESSREEKFLLQEYAREREVSAAQLIRVFQAAYSCSPVEYRLRLRLDSARRLLRYSDLSLKEIAGQLGFSDQYNFSNFFKRRVGVSPSEFRKTGEK